MLETTGLRTSISNALHIVGNLFRHRYYLHRDLFLRAVLGCSAPLSDVYDRSHTIEWALRVGYLVDHGFRKSTESSASSSSFLSQSVTPIAAESAIVSLSHPAPSFIRRWIQEHPDSALCDVHEFQLFAFSLDPDESISIGECLKDLCDIAHRKPQNVFEEIIRRREILVRRILVTSTVHRFPVCKDKYCKLSDLFSPCCAQSSFSDVEVVLNSLNRVIIRYDAPPTPDAANVSHVYAPLSSYERDVDTLLYFDVALVKRRICVGIQNKWSNDESQKLSTLAIVRAYVQFASTMLARTWTETAIFFVVIARRQLVHSPSIDVPPNVLIISLENDHLPLWLGPMFYRQCCTIPLISSSETLQMIEPDISEEESQILREDRIFQFKELIKKYNCGKRR